MSFLNSSGGASFLRADTLFCKSCKRSSLVENHFRFTDELGPEEYMEILTSHIEELEADVEAFEGITSKPRETRRFLNQSGKRLETIVGVIQTLLAEKEYLRMIPEGYLRDLDARVQMIRRTLQIKKVSPEQISILSRSGNLSMHEEEAESLVYDRGPIKVAHTNQIDLDTTQTREKRLKRIEDKFEYINLICNDLNQMVDQQSECIKQLDGNYDSAEQNAERAKDQISRFHEYQEKSSKTTYVVVLLLIGVALCTWFFLHSSLFAPAIHHSSTHKTHSN